MYQTGVISSLQTIIARFRGRDAPKKQPEENRTRPARTIATGDFSLATSEDIFAAVTRISNTFATVRCHLYKDRVIQKADPLEELVTFSPNLSQTAFMYQQTMEGFRNTDGNTYSLIVPTFSGGIDRLDILDPSRVEPQINLDTGELWYWLSGDDGRFLVHSSRIIHLRHICTNGYKGISPVRVLADTLQYDADIKRFSLSQLESGVHSPIVLEIPSEVSEEKKKSIISNFLEAYKKSNGSLIVLDAGVTTKRLNGSPVDAGVLDVEKITKNRVATVYNLPPHMLGNFGDASYSTNEQSMLEFLQLTMMAIFEMYAQEYNKKLLTRKQRQDGYYFAFDTNAALLADTQTRSDRNSKAVRSAGMTPNEVRRAENYPDSPGGDRLLISRDLVPLDLVDRLAAEYGKSITGGEQDAGQDDEIQQSKRPGRVEQRE